MTHTLAVAAGQSWRHVGDLALAFGDLEGVLEVGATDDADD